ncbi:MAG: putative porin [Bacteroidota bacterium]
MRPMMRIILSSLVLLMVVAANAQMINLNNTRGAGGSGLSFDNQGRPMRRGSGSDSLKKRDNLADSITIFFRYFDSTRTRRFDSTLNDYSLRSPIPYTHYNMGNMGSAAQSYLFQPRMLPGFDPGFHAFDIYNYSLENTRLFQTTRPYTEFNYSLASSAEQMISFLHTQNKKSNFNFSAEYRFSNAPGNLKNQNASINNFRFTSRYQTNNKRYEGLLIAIVNKNAAAENGGLENEARLDSLFNNAFELPTRLGRAGLVSRNPFNTSVNTGNIYRETTVFYRHHYDIGQKDSLVTDSSVIKLFYPRLRFEHDLNYSTRQYRFFDYNIESVNSERYRKYFNFRNPNDTIQYSDQWNRLSNTFSLISYPDKKNLSQFLKLGVTLENIRGTFQDTTTLAGLYNIYASGEYRNRTKNQVWDMEARGSLYINGLNAGDYDAFISLKRMLSKKTGYLTVGFNNVNRSPAMLFDRISSFPISNRTDYNKQNLTRLFGKYENPQQRLSITGNYYLVSNYLYFDSFFTARQAATVFNVLQISLNKQFRLSRKWNWYSEVQLQPLTGQPPVNLPLIFTRNRVAFEGTFYRNLQLSTGLEMIYHTPYERDNYSPFLGQFFVQNGTTFSNRPDIHYFMHFRIRSFQGFFRLENLNSLNIKKGFEFTQLSLLADHYRQLGLWMRFGLWWSFVN